MFLPGGHLKTLRGGGWVEFQLCGQTSISFGFKTKFDAVIVSDEVINFSVTVLDL